MRIAYYIKNTGLSGGVKVMLQHVALLNDAGYDALFVTHNIDHQWTMTKVPRIARIPGLADMPGCGIYVGTRASDVRDLHTMGKGVVVHLCQGYEPLDYEARIRGEAVTERYERKGWLAGLKRWQDRAKFRRRIEEFERVYELPTRKAAVSKHLARLIEERYGQPCGLIENGIDEAVFYPDRGRAWGKGKIRLLSVGSAHVASKGIPDTLEAVRLLRAAGAPVELVRVSVGDPLSDERQVADVCYGGLGEAQMAELYRGCDIFVSSSLEGEGFGLPVIEALASGLPVVLTDISSYRNLDDARDFASFVPVHRPGGIADAVRALTEDRELRERHIERGLSVASRFTLRHMKEDLVSFMDGLS